MAGDFRVRPVGLDRLTARLNRLAQNLPEAVGQELYRDMVGVMFESQKIVPYDEGDLHDSGETDRPEISGSSVSVSLHYGSATVDYALIQHEDLSLSHQQGGQAKFLSDPLFQWADDGPKDVAERAVNRAGRR
jgi:hypothetical protein